MYEINFIQKNKACQQENNISSQTRTVSPAQLSAILSRKLDRNATIVRVADYVCSMYRTFGSRLMITESLEGMARKFGISRVQMCRIWKEMVELGIVKKRDRGWGHCPDVSNNQGLYKLPPEYTLATIMKEPETRYMLSHILPSLKGLALSVLFCTFGYGAEHDLSTLSESSKVGHVNTYGIKNYDNIIKRVLNDTARKKKKEKGKILSPMWQACEETFPKKDNLNKNSSLVPRDYNFYDNSRSLTWQEYQELEAYINSQEIKHTLQAFRDLTIEIGMTETHKEPKRTKNTPRSVLEADNVVLLAHEQFRKIKEEQGTEKQLENERKAAETLKKLWGI